MKAMRREKSQFFLNVVRERIQILSMWMKSGDWPNLKPMLLSRKAAVKTALAIEISHDLMIFGFRHPCEKWNIRKQRKLLLAGFARYY